MADRFSFPLNKLREFSIKIENPILLVMVTELENQIAEQQNKLSQVYLDISAAYKRMSKAKDLHTRNIIQSGIDGTLKRANELSDKVEALKKEWLKHWETKRNEGGPNKSPYD